MRELPQPYPLIVGEWVYRARCGDRTSGVDPNEFQRPLRGNSQNRAKLVCVGCAVQPECLVWALENNEIWGVWGGLDEAELRRALSVDSHGRFAIRCRPPGCPNPRCRARPGALEIILIAGSQGLHCRLCGFEWRSETSVMAIRHYRKIKRQQEQKRLRVRARVAAVRVVPAVVVSMPSLGSGSVDEAPVPLSLVASAASGCG